MCLLEDFVRIRRPLVFVIVSDGALLVELFRHDQMSVYVSRNKAIMAAMFNLLQLLPCQ